MPLGIGEILPLVGIEHAMGFIFGKLLRQSRRRMNVIAGVLEGNRGHFM